MEKAKRECPACNGEGVYRFWNDERLLDAKQCERCRGTGFIIVKDWRD